MLDDIISKVGTGVKHGARQVGSGVKQGANQMGAFGRTVTSAAMAPIVPVAGKLQKHPWRRRSSTSQDRLGEDEDVLPPCGYLCIWNGSFRRWKVCYFTLDMAAGTLVYHTSAARTGASWKLDLVKSAVYSHSKSSRRFKLVTECGSYNFKASSREAAGAWVDALRAALLSTLEHRIAEAGTDERDGQSLVSEGAAATPEDEAAASGADISGQYAAAREWRKGEGEEERLQRIVDARLALRIKELSPLVADLEEQLQAAQLRVAAAVSSLTLRPPSLAPAVTVNGGEGEGREQGGAEVSAESLVERVDSWRSARSDLEDEGWTARNNVPAAWAQLMEGVTTILRKEVQRLVELEEENVALRRTARRWQSQRRGDKAALTRLASQLPPGTAATLGVDVEVGGGEASDSDGMRIMPVVSDDMSTRTTPLVLGEDVGPASGMEYDEEDMDEEDEEGSEQTSTTGQFSLAPDRSTLVRVRSALPHDQPSKAGFSIWGILKQAIGKDLSRITMPATINEPLSSIQRIAEELEYRHLLQRALSCTDAQERLLLVAAFVLSPYGATIARMHKPFNPLLGETFEWTAPDGSCTFVCEQVSHHPPISCWWATNAPLGPQPASGAYTFFGEIEMRSRFWGKAVEIFPTGTCYLRLQLPAAAGGGEELYSWNKGSGTISNIIFGKPWLEWGGAVTVTNRTTGDFARVTLHKCGGRLEQRGVVEGGVFSEGGQLVYAIGGSCRHSLTAKMVAEVAATRGLPPPQPMVLFTPTPLPASAARQYNMTALAMQLNELPADHEATLPPTDSRYRPDQKALEDAHWELATDEKLRLEDKQRQTRKVRAALCQEYHAMWFTQRGRPAVGSLVADAKDGMGEPCWQWNGRYLQRDWSDCPDIYSQRIDQLPGK